MDIGQRIRYVRNLRGLSQIELAGKVGLGADEKGRIRITQYENGTRTPKEDMLEKISKALNVNSLYLSTAPKTDALEFLFTLFDFDIDMSIIIEKENDRFKLDFDNWMFNDVFEEWMNKKAELKSGKISKEEYIEWKINYTGSNK